MSQVGTVRWALRRNEYGLGGVCRTFGSENRLYVINTLSMKQITFWIKMSLKAIVQRFSIAR